jgi:hypothetical protein
MLLAGSEPALAFVGEAISAAIIVLIVLLSVFLGYVNTDSIAGDSIEMKNVQRRTPYE